MNDNKCLAVKGKQTNVFSCGKVTKKNLYITFPQTHTFSYYKGMNKDMEKLDKQL